MRLTTFSAVAALLLVGAANACDDHDEGAHAWGRIASVIATCKLNGVEPYAWLKSTLEKIAARHPQSRVHELLLWPYSATSN